MGPRRSDITEAVHELEGRGLIKAQRALISIPDRPRLEAAAGGIYGKPEAEYRRLIGGPPLDYAVGEPSFRMRGAWAVGLSSAHAAREKRARRGGG